MISANVDENAQRHFCAIAAIFDDVVAAIEADLSTITAPDTAVLEKYPEFGARVTKLVGTAETSLKSLQAEAEGAVDWAQQLGYI
jgi:hypothetical protein